MRYSFWAWQISGAAVILALFVGIVHSADLPDLAVERGYTFLYVREKTGRNDHPEIDRMLAYLGLPKGLSWCAAYSLYCYKLATDDLREKQPFPRYGRVATLRKACMSNPLKYTYITADQVRLGSAQLQPGDLPLWAHGTIRDGDFNGHTGLVVQQLTPRTFRSIEGNTSSGNQGSQREGNGVFVRTREISPGTFRILGFCRARL